MEKVQKNSVNSLQHTPLSEAFHANIQGVPESSRTRSKKKYSVCAFMRVCGGGRGAETLKALPEWFHFINLLGSSSHFQFTFNLGRIITERIMVPNNNNNNISNSM
jgi:hypothetical protein